MPVSTIRFLVLDMVERHGPMHGYEMVRAAARESLALWIEYTAPAMYSATKRLVSEGLLEVIRVEREGRYPPRQIFQITQDGHAALRDLRRDAQDDVKAPTSDPFDYALTHLHEHELADLAGVIQSRLDVLQQRLEQRLNVREETGAGLTLTERYALDHGETRLRAEIEWHSRLLASVPTVVAEARSIRRR